MIIISDGDIQDPENKDIHIYDDGKVDIKIMDAFDFCDFVHQHRDAIWQRCSPMYSEPEHWTEDQCKDEIVRFISSLEPYEHLIAREASRAYYYAHDVLEHRFIAGEKTISKVSIWAYFYARYVLEARWIEAEPALKTDPVYGRSYEEWLNIKL